MAAPHRAGELKCKRSPAAVRRGRNPPCSGAVSRRPWPRSHPRRRIYSADLTTRCSPVPSPAPPRQIKAAGGGHTGSASRPPPGEGAGSRARTAGIPRGPGRAGLALAAQTAGLRPQGSRSSAASPSHLGRGGGARSALPSAVAAAGTVAARGTVTQQRRGPPSLTAGRGSRGGAGRVTDA